MKTMAIVARRVLLIGVLAIGGLCLASESFAQEGDPNGAALGSGSVVAPSPWLNVNVPLRDRVGLKLYGFFIGGELDLNRRNRIFQLRKLCRPHDGRRHGGLRKMPRQRDLSA